MHDAAKNAGDALGKKDKIEIAAFLASLDTTTASYHHEWFKVRALH